MVTSKKELVAKWSNIEGPLSIANIEDEFLKESMAQCLENQSMGDGEIISQINEASNGANSTASLGTLGLLDGSQNSDAYKFKPIALAMVRRTLPELFANKVVGVQAMNGPVGLAYAMRVVYNDGNSNEASWEEVDKYAGYTGSQVYTSGVLDTSNSFNDTSATGAVLATAEAWEISGGAGGTWPDLKIRIDQKTLTAKTRKLAASFSLESAQDLKATHGIEIEREMLNFLQYEVIAELDRELLYRMKSAAVNTANGGASITAINVSGAALDGRWSAEKYKNIVTAIINQANVIAVKTRRGPGNFVIVSPQIATVLQAAGHPFIQNTAKVNATTIGVSEIGTLNQSITVYRDSYARADYALVGFKGPTTADAGIIFAPYITGLTQRAISPNDFSPRIGILSRYEIVDNMLGSGRYYRYLPFTNVGQIIAGGSSL